MQNCFRQSQVQNSWLSLKGLLENARSSYVKLTKLHMFTNQLDVGSGEQEIFAPLLSGIYTCEKNDPCTFTTYFPFTHHGNYMSFLGLIPTEHNYSRETPELLCLLLHEEIRNYTAK